MPYSSPDSAVERILKAMRQADQTGNQAVLLRQYEKFLKLRPDNAKARAEAARLYLQHGDLEKARPHVKKALEAPYEEKVDSLLFPLMSLHDHYKNDLESARAWYGAAPNKWRVQLFIKALLKAERFAEAEPLLCQYLEQPQEPTLQAWLLTMLSECYHAMRRFPEAIACAQLVLEAKPDDHEALLQLGKNHEKLGRYSQALEYFRQMLEKRPDDPDAHRHIASLMLKIGRFSEGWEHWEWRWAKSLAKQTQNFPIPEWQGEPLADKILIVWAEQGIGDEIMFASILSELPSVGGKIYYECDKRLIPLFSRSYPDINYIPNTYKYVKRWPKADYHIPAGNLCKIFRSSLDSFGSGVSYLAADKNQANRKRLEYQKLFPEKRLIGISWRGGNAGTNKFSRSLKLEDMLPLAQIKDLQLINLQYGNTEEERNLLAEQFDIYLHNDIEIDPLKDIDAQAAQISALDAVITIDNTTAHLAGALGTPTYILLPLDPDWRWGLETDKSYWYESVTLVRNPTPSDWKASIETVQKKLSGIPGASAKEVH
ncbi:tetratricopeptide repeat protein [Pseudomonas saudiphocaensis]|uniref:tetratricopeptide repeat protein n=1 Tax=Pseudomonas saudiphocaensis TaxID=1499686 RepID=UPI000F78E692|nr:tetratricopeptide repeat protein [Pseudomonas saudiphocaensis]RRV16109.1 tetratricopeptide repeat protein [Pseudomonas saudiphocaensis]